MKRMIKFGTPDQPRGVCPTTIAGTPGVVVVGGPDTTVRA